MRHGQESQRTPTYEERTMLAYESDVEDPQDKEAAIEAVIISNIQMAKIGSGTGQDQSSQ